MSASTLRMGSPARRLPAFADQLPRPSADYATDARIRHFFGVETPRTARRKRTRMQDFGSCKRPPTFLLWRRLCFSERRQEGQLLVARLATPGGDGACARSRRETTSTSWKRRYTMKRTKHLVEMDAAPPSRVADRARVDFALAMLLACADALHRSSTASRATGRFSSASASPSAASLHRTVRAVVALDHLRHQELGRFKGREAFLAGEAFAAAADLPTFAGEARVGDLRVPRDRKMGNGMRAAAACADPQA